jgi:hypothetical protein
VQNGGLEHEQEQRELEQQVSLTLVGHQLPFFFGSTALQPNCHSHGMPDHASVLALFCRLASSCRFS